MKNSFFAPQPFWMLATFTLLVLSPCSTPRADTVARAKTDLTDAQIAKIVRTANDGEIRQGKLAEKKSKNQEVQNFAKMMIQQHEHVNHDLKEVTQSENIRPQNSSDASSLRNDADKTLSNLKSLQGPEFDRAYLDAQVKAHQDVLNSIDSSLLPFARDAKLQAMLKDVRPEVENHLNHAKKLQTALAASG